MANRKLGDNPLFRQTGEPAEAEVFDAEVERQKLGITLPAAGEKRVGRPEKADLVRDNAAQNGLTKEWTRATFIVRVESLEMLKDYAYTERISLKEALDQALDEFLADVDQSTLLRRK